MADSGSDIAAPSGSAPEAPQPRRVHTYSRLTTALAVLALATALYALFRLDSTADKLDRLSDSASGLEASRTLLDAQVKNLESRQRQSAQELDKRLDGLEELPKHVQELMLSVEQLRGHAEGPERAWSRAEALFLLELAQHRITLDRDVETAIAALEAADLRLAALRDQTFASVRQQIARELQALRSVHRPDIVGIVARLASTEEQVMRLPVKGIVASEREKLSRAATPEGMLARAWAMTKNALSNLVVVTDVEDETSRIVTDEEALLRRQYLQLLLLSARTAVARHDEVAYRQALSSARRVLSDFFDLSSPAGQAVLANIQALEPVNIDPELPDISRSSELLRRLVPAQRAPR